MCSHPEYNRKHPLPTHWPPHRTPSPPPTTTHPVQVHRPQWVTAGRREERWGCCARHEGEEGLETLETTLGKVNMIHPHTHTHKCTHWPAAIVCCMTGHLAPTHTPSPRSVVKLGDGRHRGLGLAGWRHPVRYFIQLVPGESVCMWDDCMASFIIRPSLRESKTLHP